MIASVREAARLTHVPASTIRRWLSEGRLVEYDDRPRHSQVDVEEVDQLADLLGRTRHARNA